MRKATTVALYTLLIILCISSYCRTMHQQVACFEERIAVYIEIPKSHNGMAVLFVPAPGYMDHSGKHGTKNARYSPKQGVFREWKNKLNRRGYITIQFDKPGTGASSGRLMNQEELALLCVYTSLKTLETKLNGIFLFTFAGGFDYFRYAYNAMKEVNPKTMPIGVVHLAGIIPWTTNLIHDQIPVLSLLGDTTALTGIVQKFKKETIMNADNFSKMILLPNTDVNLCDKSFPKYGNKCVYPEDMYQKVFVWIDEMLKNYKNKK